MHVEGEQQAAFRMRVEYVENALAAHTVLGRGQQAFCEQHASLEAHLDRLVDESVYKYIQRGRPQKVGDDRHVSFRERMRRRGCPMGAGVWRSTDEGDGSTACITENSCRSCKEEVSTLRRILGDCALKIARTHSAGGGRHATLQAEHSKFQAGQQARGALHVALQKRVSYLEVLLGDSEEHHAGWKRAHAERGVLRVAWQERLESVPNGLGAGRQNSLWSTYRVAGASAVPRAASWRVC